MKCARAAASISELDLTQSVRYRGNAQFLRSLSYAGGGTILPDLLLRSSLAGCLIDYFGERVVEGQIEVEAFPVG